jgi:multidrug efflux pump subunit AcrA (membrane-fusion protein)
MAGYAVHDLLAAAGALAAPMTVARPRQTALRAAPPPPRIARAAFPAVVVPVSSGVKRRRGPGRTRAVVWSMGAAIGLAAVALAATKAATIITGRPDASLTAAGSQAAPETKSELTPTLAALTSAGPDKAEPFADPGTRVRIWPRVSGTVDSVRVSSGQRVRRGDLLFTLDPTDQQRAVELKRAEVQEKQAQLRLAVQTEAAAAQGLIDGKAPANDLRTAATAVSVARARLKSALAAHRMALDQVRYTNVVAPCDGQVVQRNLQPGEPVVAGTAAAGGEPPIVLAVVGQPALDLPPRAPFGGRRTIVVKASLVPRATGADAPKPPGELF